MATYNEQVIRSWRASGKLRIGSIKVVNNYVAGSNGQVEIQLFHSDAPGQVFGKWTITGGSEDVLALNGNPINIGSDWGIRVLFGNGVVSEIYAVGEVGEFVGNQHVVKASDIYEGHTHPAPGPEHEIRGGVGHTSMGGGWAEASATLYRDGRLIIQTHAVSEAPMSGTYGRVFVVGVDSKGRSIFVSTLFNMPTACSILDTCSSNRRRNFQQQIDPVIAKYAAKIDVYVEDADGGKSAREAILKIIIETWKTYNDLPPEVKAAIAAAAAAAAASG